MSMQVNLQRGVESVVSDEQVRLACVGERGSGVVLVWVGVGGGGHHGRGEAASMRMVRTSCG